LTPETVAKIGEIPGIAAFKDSSGDLEFIRKVRKLSPIAILSGDDDLTYETLREGGVGSISVIGNAFPRAWKTMIDLALKGQWAQSKAISERYLPLCKALFLETNPQGLKFLMQWLGLDNGSLRLPLVPVTEETESAIKQALVSLSLPQLERIRIQH
jgi:4-hydroxy-tetrahydrodipicolinate synthase